MVFESEPSERPVSETVTVPDRLSVEVLAEALIVIVLPLVETEIQLPIFDVVNVPSVVTATVFEPPSESKVRFPVERSKYLPFCVTVTLAEPALFCTVIDPVRVVGVLFSAIEAVMLTLLNPPVEDGTIHDTSEVAVQLAFEVMLIVLDVAAEVVVIVVGFTVGAMTFVAFWVTLISLLREPELRLVSFTVILPVRVDVPVLTGAITVIVLPLVVTVSQSVSDDAVNVPSVVTVTLSVPPSASKVRLPAESSRYLPFCVTVTLAEPALFCTVIDPVRVFGVLFSETDTVMLALLDPSVEDNVIQFASSEAVQ